MLRFKLGSRMVGLQKPVYFIADIAANHDGKLGRAIKLIELAARAGANAAKFQNFQAGKIVSKYGFEKLGRQLSHQAKWKKSVFQVYQDASINPGWTPALKKACRQAGIDYFTSPYDFESVNMVDPYVEVYKIGSGDITWPEMIDFIAVKGKPVIIAAGASNMEDVKRAMKILLKRTQKIVLMQCNTNYTASRGNFRYINLNVLKTFGKLYPDVLLGLSDHTRGHATVLGAVALGARVIEKHFTDDNYRSGPDHLFSMNPKTWEEMVQRTRELEASLGDGNKRIEKNEKESVVVQRRSIRAGREFKKGDVITSADLEVLRPCPRGGLPPYLIGKVIGRSAARDIVQGQHIQWKDLK